MIFCMLVYIVYMFWIKKVSMKLHNVAPENLNLTGIDEIYVLKIPPSKSPKHHTFI